MDRERWACAPRRSRRALWSPHAPPSRPPTAGRRPAGRPAGRPGRARARARPRPPPPLPAPAPMTTYDEDRQKVVELRWAPVAGAASYAVQVGTDPYWSDEADLFPLTTVVDPADAAGVAAARDYLWRVAAVGADGVRGTVVGAPSTRSRRSRSRTSPSPAAGPTCPQLQRAGARRRVLPDLPLDARCRTASEYQIQVTDDPAFARPRPARADARRDRLLLHHAHDHDAVQQAEDRGQPRRRQLLVRGPAAPRQPLYWRVRALDAVSRRGGGAGDEAGRRLGHLRRCRPPPPRQLDTSDCPEALARRRRRLRARRTRSRRATGRPLQVWDRSRPVAVRRGRLPPAAPGRDGAAAGRPVHAQPACAATCRRIDWDEVPRRDLLPDLRRPRPTVHQHPGDRGDARDDVHARPCSGATAASTPSYYYAVQACTTRGLRPGHLVAAVVPQGQRPGACCCTRTSPRTDTVLRWDDYADELGELGDAALGGRRVPRAGHPRRRHRRSPRRVEDVVTDHTSYVSPTTRYGEGNFLWRVQAVDASGHKLRWSAPRVVLPRLHRAPVVRVTSGLTSIDPRADRHRSCCPSRSPARTPRRPASPPRPAGACRPAAGRAVRRHAHRRPDRHPAGRRRVRARAHQRHHGRGRQRAARPYAEDGQRQRGARRRRNGAFTYAGTWTTPRPRAWCRPAATTWPPRPAPRRRPSPSGTGVRVYGCRGPSGGKLELRVDGVLKATVDTYRSYSSCGTLAEVGGLRAGTHTVQVKVLGTRRPRPSRHRCRPRRAARPVAGPCSSGAGWVAWCG